MLKRQVIVMAALVVVLSAVGESARSSGKRPGNMALPGTAQPADAQREEAAPAPAQPAPVEAAPVPVEPAPPPPEPPPVPASEPPASAPGAVAVEEAAPLETAPATAIEEPPPPLETVPGDEPAPRVEIPVPAEPPRAIQVTGPDGKPAVDVIFEKPKADAPVLKDAKPATLEDVLAELQRLRAEVLRLQQTVDVYSGGLLATVQEENRKLREQLRDAYKEGAVSVPNVPAPDKALLQRVLQEADGGPVMEAAIDDAAPEAAAVPRDVSGMVASPGLTAVAEPVKEAPKKSDKGYEVVSEWGRSPEEAKSLQPAKASLKGLIGWVKPGTDDETLSAIGRKMRKDFDGYDNINVEIFDSEKAAHEFKGGREGGEHRVLSISKYRDSSRDVILLIRGDVVQEVPRENP